MCAIGQSFTLRITLSFTVCACLLLLPNVSLFVSEASQGQSVGRVARPRGHKPEGTWPDLEEVKNESELQREPPAPIPSTMRSRRNEGKPWDGRRVGDPEPPPQPVDHSNDSEKQTRRAHARRRVSPPLLYEDQFIQNFFSLVLLRSATSEETTYWNYLLRACYNQNQTSLKLAAIELGTTLFESASYAARNRDAHGYVYDLYKTYLMREPDAGGWSTWEAVVSTHGREYVRRGFEESGEFATLLASISLSGSAGTSAASLITARVEPRNQPGNGMLSRDARWSVPLLSLPGRNGLNLGLALAYSSMVWTRSGPYFYFDEDNGFPSPGFRLGFPTVQRKTFNAQTGKNAYLLLTPAGHRVELRQTATATVYEAADSSFLQLTETGATLLVRSTDGTQLTLVEGNGEYRCTQIKDRNGNYITVAYNAQGQLTSITETLGRVITFNYDGNANLLSITQAWNGQPSHQWVSFSWSTRNMQNSFAEAAVIGIRNGNSVPVITQVGLNDTSYFTFDYTNSLQVSVIKNYFGTLERNATTFGYETPAGDVPRLMSSSVSAENWTGINGVPAQVTTQFSVAGDGACVMTAPDGTIYKEYYGTGWQKGLTTLSEIWSGGVKQKWTTTAWTQDNTSVTYEVNPRVTETNVYDAGGNRRRTVIDYGPYAQYGLPYLVKEYAADAVTEIRNTYTDYNLSQAYLDRRLIGLVSAVHLTNVSSWQGKISYGYDDPARLAALPAPATQHDAAYNSSFTARGNLTSVSKWDFNDIVNASKTLTSYTNYYVTGSPKSTTDPANHINSISYTDAFSDSVNRNTFAYPTALTDADGFSSTVQYIFDFGATTRTQSPAPAGQSQGAIQTMTYNNLAQLERVTTTNNGAYKRFWYGSNYVASYATVNSVTDDLFAIHVVDGFGRAISTGGNHPGSGGGYRLRNTIYDQMGRATKVSNPTEVNSSWTPSGDDSAGLYYTEQSYDWKGRPLVTTNPDSTTRSASYSGCGCAGGEVVTLTDEGTIDGGVTKRRQQKLYSDVLGRTSKIEILNWQNGSVYSATVNTYNIRDQLTQVRQYAGAEGSGSYQDTTVSYDGYGRVKTRHLPEQQVDLNNSFSTDHTTWDYNADDTVQKLTDARGASQTFTYNGRHLLTGITYAVPTDITTITAVQPVSFGYDAAGNRTSMTDGNGRTDYTYNQLSKMLSETRQFNGLSGSYALNYDYNFAGQLKSITDPTNATINYGYDTRGLIVNVTGSTYGGVSQYASGFAYRAWGALKGLSYGNNLTRSVSYNARLQPTQFEVAGQPPQYGSSTIMKTQYQYFDDGALKYADDLLDNRFDRAYGYDQVSRLKEDFSGSEAFDLVNQTNSGTTTGPYRQSYSYDSWSNATSRTGRFWSRETTFSASYSNGRNTSSLWQYDADGRAVREAGLKYTYDAAGRNVVTSSILVNNFTGGRVTQSRDGDGFEIKREETRQGGTEVGYRLRSSVLGENVVTELNSNGQKLKTYVYLGGERLAEQDGGFVVWKHTNPLTGSEGSSFTSGLYIPEKELDPMLVDVGFEDPYLYFEEPNPDSLKLLGGNSNGQCMVEGMAWDCMSAQRLVELGVADEVVPSTVYAVYKSGKMKPIWTGNARPDPLGRTVSTSPIATPASGTGSTGHDPDTGFTVLAGTSDSSVTVIAGAEYVSSGQQSNTQKTSCSFNINLKNASRVHLSKSNMNVLEKELNLIFATAGHTATVNNPAGATTSDFNYNLTLYDNFPSSYPQGVRFDETAIGYTRMTRQIADSSYPDIYFPGPIGGVSVNHIRASYGVASTNPSTLAFIVAGIGAHEMLAHYLLMDPGHEHPGGITTDGFDYRKNVNRFISPEVKSELDKICSSGQLPK